MLKSKAFLLGVVAALAIIVSLLLCSVAMAQSPTPSAPQIFTVALPMVVKAPELQRMSDNTGPCAEMDGVQYYDWSAYPVGCDIPFVPMVWSIDNIHDTWQVSQAQQFDMVLGFNEPNIDNPAAGKFMTMSELSTAWREMEQTFDRFSSPAMCPKHSCPYLSYYLLDWLDAYHGTYGEYPKFDVAALHFYGTDAKGTPAQNAAALQAYLDSIVTGLAQRGYDVPIWITEFGYWAQGSTRYEQAAEFIELSISYLQTQPRVRYVCWFGIRPGNFPDYVVTLRDTNGNLTATGEAWQEW